ncbi:MAG: alpha/beta fold hydrolase [Alistipes shahii]|uniref:alpha/beta fold hydrolase n=1 Tax=Alistipes shahii TaxID=328814 RepID=UPI00399CEB5F
MLVWEDFIPFLYKEVRVVTLDLPGHGISVVAGEEHPMEFLADTVADGLRELGIEQPHARGDTRWAATSRWLSANAIPRCSTVCDVAQLDAQCRHSGEGRKPPPRNRAREGRQKGAAGPCGSRSGLCRREPPPDERLYRRSHRTGFRHRRRRDRRPAERNDRPQGPQRNAARNESPHAVHPRPQGRLHPVEAAEKMVAEHPEAQVVWLENSGHMGFLEEPEAAAQAILGFVRAEKRS